MADEDGKRSFDIIVTRSTGPDGAILVMVDGTFGEDGQPPLRILVNDEPVFAQADHVAGEREAEAVSLTVQPHQIDYTGGYRQ